MTDAPLPPTVAEFDISGLEAMLAGTLCLMSAYSHGEKQPAQQQELISAKIISNLSCLQCQNCLSPEFRRVLSKVCEAWRLHLGLAASTPAAHWHLTPSSLQ